MRATIEAHNQDAIASLMQQLGTQNPSVAVNHVIHLYKTGFCKGFDSPKGKESESFDISAIDIPDWG
jgi:hypothetical protein